MRLFKAITLSGRRRRAAAAMCEADPRHPCVVFRSAHTVTAQVRILTGRGSDSGGIAASSPLQVDN
jgi:hypothetical protein